MNPFRGLVVRSSAAPTVEIDPTCHSAYVRFKTARVRRTIANNGPRTVVTVDLDARGKVIGVELVGVREFSIASIRHHLPAPLKQVNLERARFVPATAESPRALVPA